MKFGEGTSPRLKVVFFSIGSVLLFFIIWYIYSGPIIIIINTAFIVYFFIYIFKADNSNKERTGTPDNQDQKIADLKKEIETYLHERDHALQELSPLKTANKDLKSQIERQHLNADNLISEIKDLKKEQKGFYHERQTILEELFTEKQKSKMEYKKIEDRLTETEARLRSEIEQLTTNNFQLEMEKISMEKDLKLVINENNLMKAQYQREVNEIQQKERDRHNQLTEFFNTEYNKKEEELKSCKKLLLEKEETTKELQELITKTSEELQKANDECQHLKLRLENLSKETSVPVCNICEDRERNAFLDPCGHTLCMVCATEVMSRNQKCPVCRKSINYTKNIFLS